MASRKHNQVPLYVYTPRLVLSDYCVFPGIGSRILLIGYKASFDQKRAAFSVPGSGAGRQSGQSRGQMPVSWRNISAAYQVSPCRRGWDLRGLQASYTSRCT